MKTTGTRSLIVYIFSIAFAVGLLFFLGEYVLEEGIELKEARSGVVYRIGQQVQVQVASVDVSAGQVNFVLAD